MMQESLLQPVIARLSQEAKQWCDATPPSVMDKAVVPPSGDKHDYMSVGTYWWPNPDTPDGLPYVRRDGLHSPDHDKYDRPAMDAMIDAVTTLHSAWEHFGNVEYAQVVSTYLDKWFLDPATRMNPHLNFGQAIPGACEGRCIGIVDTWRCVEVVPIIEALSQAHVLSSNQYNSLKNWFNAYLDWLLDSEHGREETEQHNNHGVQYDLQVVTYATFVGRDTLARQVLEALSTCRIFPQIEPDGSMPHEQKRTRSWYYTLFNIHLFLSLMQAGHKFDLPMTDSKGSAAQRVCTAMNFFLEQGGLDERWPYEQIVAKEFDFAAKVLIQAYAFWDDDRYAEAAVGLLKSEQSTHPVFLSLTPIAEGLAS